MFMLIKKMRIAPTIVMATRRITAKLLNQRAMTTNISNNYTVSSTGSATSTQALSRKLISKALPTRAAYSHSAFLQVASVSENGESGESSKNEKEKKENGESSKNEKEKKENGEPSKNEKEKKENGESPKNEKEKKKNGESSEEGKEKDEKHAWMKKMNWLEVLKVGGYGGIIVTFWAQSKIAKKDKMNSDVIAHALESEKILKKMLYIQPFLHYSTLISNDDMKSYQDRQAAFGESKSRFEAYLSEAEKGIINNWHYSDLIRRLKLEILQHDIALLYNEAIWLQQKYQYKEALSINEEIIKKLDKYKTMKHTDFSSLDLSMAFAATYNMRAKLQACLKKDKYSIEPKEILDSYGLAIAKLDAYDLAIAKLYPPSDQLNDKLKNFDVNQLSINEIENILLTLNQSVKIPNFAYLLYGTAWALLDHKTDFGSLDKARLLFLKANQYMPNEPNILSGIGHLLHKFIKYPWNFGVAENVNKVNDNDKFNRVIKEFNTSMLRFDKVTDEVTKEERFKYLADVAFDFYRRAIYFCDKNDKNTLANIYVLRGNLYNTPFQC